MSGYSKHSDPATCFFRARSKQKPNAIHVFSPRVSLKIQYQTVVKLKNLPAEPHQTNSADLIYMFSIIVLNCLFQINCELSTTKYMHMKSAGCGWHSRWHNYVMFVLEQSNVANRAEKYVSKKYPFAFCVRVCTSINHGFDSIHTPIQTHRRWHMNGRSCAHHSTINHRDTIKST